MEDFLFLILDSAGNVIAVGVGTVSGGASNGGSILVGIGMVFGVIAAFIAFAQGDPWAIKLFTETFLPCCVIPVGLLLVTVLFARWSSELREARKKLEKRVN